MCISHQVDHILGNKIVSVNFKVVVNTYFSTKSFFLFLYFVGIVHYGKKGMTVGA